VTAAAFAALFVALLVGHHLGDYLLQSQWQADHKGDHPGHDHPDHRDTLTGWRAAVGHVASYTIATVTTTSGVALALHLPITLTAFIAAHLLSSGSHLVIDRRYTLRAAMAALDKVIPGKLAYYDDGGAPFLDQMAHILFLFGAGLLMVAPLG
jgi:uncharacterized membrane protein YdfJ with MMPL/SSD domain